MRQTINKVLERSSGSAMPTSLAIEGKRLSKERNIAEALNHFVSVGPKLADQIEQNSNTEKVCWY